MAVLGGIYRTQSAPVSFSETPYSPRWHLTRREGHTRRSTGESRRRSEPRWHTDNFSLHLRENRKEKLLTRLGAFQGEDHLGSRVAYQVEDRPFQVGSLEADGHMPLVVPPFLGHRHPMAFLCLRAYPDLVQLRRLHCSLPALGVVPPR